MAVFLCLQLTFSSPPSQISLWLIFALLATTYIRIAFITNLSRDKAVFFSLHLAFTSPPSQVCLELIFALLTTTYLRIAFITI